MLNVVNDQHDPYLNMAIEEYLLTELAAKEDCFMLWQNRPAVIVGRNQNAWEEINQTFVRTEQIAVVRRLTGGGAVYHDLGNLNFTFVVKDSGPGFDFRRFGRVVISALATLGLQAELTGRNDIQIASRKFSGNSEYRRSGLLLHHGTLLFSSDLSVLSQALKVKPQKMASKGVKSVRSRVTNIDEHLPQTTDLEQFKLALLQAAAAEFGQELRDYTLSAGDMQAIKGLRDRKYATWEWNFGQAPEFNLRREQRFPSGEVDVRLNIRHGVITACYIFGDFFTNNEVRELAQRLVGRQYSQTDLTAALAETNVTEYLPGLNNEQFVQLLTAPDELP